MRQMLIPALVALSGCGKKDTASAPPPVGWFSEEGWTMQCYFPPDFDTMNETDRRMKRSQSMDEMLSQWGGKRDDGVSFGDDLVMEVETVLLGRPDNIQAVLQQNLNKCKQAAGGGGSAEWKSWAGGLAAVLTEGECGIPLDYTMFDYLDIESGWQRTLSICQGNVIRISGSESDQYRISDKGPWMNVAGDTSGSSAGADWPCNFEGCYPGQLIMRFVSEAGIETVMPVGLELIFEAPEHGKISYRINDVTLYDNKWYQQGSIIDHTSIEITPMDRVE
ncbi:MAG: hypothetical protein P8R54_28735 [Myxococcota bacterium]|nr:hypothetical protein [Myxococcota bacterium]